MSPLCTGNVQFFFHDPASHHFPTREGRKVLFKSGAYRAPAIRQPEFLLT